MAEHEDQSTCGSQTNDPQGNRSVGHPDVQSHRESEINRGSTASGFTAGNPTGEVGTSTSELRDYLRSRPASGIPGHRKVDPSEILLQAFLDGNFEVALIAAQELQSAYRESLLEAAKLRFRLNFGTPICENCEGLKAGPGVLATCFQVKKCEFQSILEGNVSPRQLRILQKITSG